MITEPQNKIIQRYFEEFMKGRKLEIADEIFTPNFDYHDPLSAPHLDLEGFKHYMRSLYNAFPDVRITLKELKENGNRIGAHWNIQGTFTNEFEGLKPHGKPVSFNGIDFLTINSTVNKIEKVTVKTNPLLMMMQFGVVNSIKSLLFPASKKKSN